MVKKQKLILDNITSLPNPCLPDRQAPRQGERKVLQYCSLDIETTGFDPLTEEILEVGFCFFEVTKKGINITEEWTQVFKPSKEVNPKILGLTGITQKELDNAPTFSVYKEFLQVKLGSAIIVGHNIVFDIRFLEQFGIKFSGEKIDTLDLVQWLLPTRHSYNLESLMHFFKVPHTEAHRALADAKAALKVLEKLLLLYFSFPKNLKDEIGSLIRTTEFLWKDWLNKDFVQKQKADIDVKKHAKRKDVKTDLKLLPKNLYNFPLFSEYLPEVIAALNKDKNKSILVLQKKTQVMDFWEKGFVEPIFLSEDLFDEKKFEKYFKKKNKTEDEVRFLLKILVWKYTNWQNVCLLDLNLSFFGGQFKENISKTNIGYNAKAKVLVCDYQTFLELAEGSLETERKIVINSISEFENILSSGLGQKVSWGYVSYLLKGIYNPETQIGSQTHKELVSELLSATDLFFGLSCAMLKNEASSFEYFKVTETAQYFENFIKLKKASEGYIEKLLAASNVLKMESLIVVAKNLESFFKEEPNRVKWLELAESRSVFLNCPLNLGGIVKNIIKKFPKTVFTSSLPKGSVIDLFISRLGLEGFRIKNEDAKTLKKSFQQDLFSVLPLKKNKIGYYFLEKNLDTSEILKWCKKNNLPTAVLFQNPLAIRDFYEKNFEELGKTANLLAQNQSGGSNKIFRNFKIYKDSVLLVTDKFVLKYLENSNNGLENLSVKTLIIGRLPFEQYTHPYLEAVASSFENSFEQFSLPRTLLNILKLITFFYSPELETLIIADNKLQKPYAQVFKEFLFNQPNFKNKV